MFTTFRKLDLFPSSGKKEGQKPGPGLRLAQPGGPTAKVSVLPFYLKTEEDPVSETL
jgi:hypothetical protein